MVLTGVVPWAQTHWQDSSLVCAHTHSCKAALYGGKAALYGVSTNMSPGHTFVCMQVCVSAGWHPSACPQQHLDCAQLLNPWDVSNVPICLCHACVTHVMHSQPASIRFGKKQGFLVAIKDTVHPLTTKLLHHFQTLHLNDRSGRTLRSSYA